MLTSIYKVLAHRHRGRSIYEKEYMALQSAVDKWRHYLQYKHFIVRTDHHSLKYLLEQKVTTAIQQKALTKLMALDYEVQYKNKAENRVANALSRQFEGRERNIHNQSETVNLLAISTTEPKWMLEISQSNEGDAQARAIITVVTTDQQGPHIYQYSAGILNKKGKLYIGSSRGLRQHLISTFHDSLFGGHSGQLGTLKRLSQVFFAQE